MHGNQRFVPWLKVADLLLLLLLLSDDADALQRLKIEEQATFETNFAPFSLKSPSFFAVFFLRNVLMNCF